MWEMGKAVLEWAGINLLTAQIMAWLTANGALGLLILVALGVILVFAAAVLLVHKLDRIPFNIPYARALIPLAVVIAMIVLLGVMGMAMLMYFKDGPGPPTTPRPVPGAAVEYSAPAGPTGFEDRGGP